MELGILGILLSMVILCRLTLMKNLTMARSLPVFVQLK